METVKSFLESLANVLDDQPELKGGLTLATLGVTAAAMLRWGWGLLRPHRAAKEPPVPALSVKIERGDIDIKIGGR